MTLSKVNNKIVGCAVTKKVTRKHLLIVASEGLCQFSLVHHKLRGSVETVSHVPDVDTVGFLCQERRRLSEVVNIMLG